jgi:hypothetical protein
LRGEANHGGREGQRSGRVRGPREEVGPTEHAWCANIGGIGVDPESAVVPSRATSAVLEAASAATRGSRQQSDFVGPADGATEQRVARYAIFRWDDRNQMHEDDGKALPVGFVDHRPGTNKYTFIDRSASAPTVARDAGKVFWYTVRAVQDTACGPLVSPNSAPARGIPRDRVGPSGSPPNLTVREPVPSLKFQPLAIEGGGTNLPENGRRYVLRAARKNREVSWVEITVVDKTQPTGAATLGRHYFPPVIAPAYGSHATATTFTTMEWNYISTNRGPLTNIVTFGLANGLPSEKFIVVAPTPPAGNFAGGVQMDLSLGWTNVPAGPDHNAHYPRDLTPEQRALGGKVSGVPIDMSVSVDARQWRIYRKLDDGPIAMIAEGCIMARICHTNKCPVGGASVCFIFVC